MKQQQPTTDWEDVRDDDGVLLFKWSPRLRVMEFPVRRRERGGTRHHTELRRVPLDVFANHAERQTVDNNMAAVV